MKKILINAFVLILVSSFAFIGEAFAATCSWEKEGSTKLIISGNGTFKSSDCTLPDWKTKATAIDIQSGVTEIEKRAFANMQQVTSLTIGNTVTTIGERAFYNMREVTGNLVIPNSVKTIGNSAFRYMNKVTSLKIGNSVTTIGDSAFRDMSGVTILTIGNSVKIINQYAFENMEKVTVLTIPNSVTYIGTAAFKNMTGTTYLTIGSSVVTIEEEAFYGMNKVTDLIIPNSVTKIGNSAFYGMSSVKGTLVIPPSVKTIGNKAFYGMSNVTGALIIPDSVTSIDKEAFNGMSGVTEITIPSSVTSIGERAFKEMNSVTGITIPDNLNTDNWNAETFYKFPSNITVSCMGEISGCQNRLKKFISKAYGGSCTNNCLNIASIVSVNENLCQKKDIELTCQMINYNLSYSQRNSALKNPNAVCTACPLDNSYWSCAVRQTSSSTSYTKASVDVPDNPETCTNFKTFNCSSMGYYLSTNEVGRIPRSFSCSACPLDGTRWACASTRSIGLVR